MKLKFFGAVALAMTVASGAAHAATYAYSYTFSNGDVVSGELEGTLQADGNKVVVDDILSSDYNGASLTDIDYVDSVTGYALGSTTPSTVSLDGTFMDFLACDTAACGDGFAIKTTGYWGNDPWAVAGQTFGLNQEGYDAGSWTLTAVAAVPLPASALLLLTSLGGVALLRRRKQKAAA